LSGPVPEEAYHLPIGKARLARSGEQLSIITYGFGVKWAEDYCEQENMDADIIDLRSLLPIDYDTIEISVRKTNRVLILHEDTLLGGIGGEIAAHISEHCFEFLDAPVIRVGSLDTPVPFSKSLEQQFLPTARLKDAINRLLQY
jgi:2-oxoisovalerate dehydrogenase E1 component